MAKKEKAPKAPKAAKPQTIAGDPQKALLIGAAGSAVITALACVALLMVVLQVSAKAQLDQFAQARAEGAANVLAQLLEERQSHLDSLGTGAPIIAASEAATTAAVSEQVAILHEHFPKATRIHLIPMDKLGATRVAVDENGLRNNIEIDLAGRAFQRSDKRAPELYRVGNEWFVSIAAAVANSPTDTPVGVLFVSFDATIVQSVLDKLSEGQGELELLNEFKSGDAISVAKAGSAGSQGEGKAELFKYWRMRFTPSDAIAAQMTAIPLLGWIITALAALLAGLMAFIAHRQLLATVQGEAAAVQDYLRSLADDPDAEPPLFAIAALKDLANSLGVQLQRLATAKPAKAKPAKASAAAAPVAGAEDAPVAEEAPMADPLFQEMEITDLDSLEDLEDSLLLDDDAGFLDGGSSDALPAEIFRAYDIRGVAESQLSDSVAYRIGRAVGSEAQEKGQSTVCVGRDGRLSSPMLRDNLVRGLTESGCDVIDVGIVPTPPTNWRAVPA